MRNNIAKGKKGEDGACKYLVSKGYNIKDRNYKTKIGEIDIIASKEDVLIFIEVKSRTNMNYGYPYEAVNKAKQQKILKSSLIYMNHRNIRGFQLRYDIIEVFLNEKSRINHIKNAFCF